jgi:hypothetical protein
LIDLDQNNNKSMISSSGNENSKVDGSRSDELQPQWQKPNTPPFQPSNITYRALLEASAEAGNPTMATDILERIIRDFYNEAKIDHPRRQRQQHQHNHQQERMKTPPIVTTRSFNLVLRAWANSNRPDASHRIQQGLIAMKALYSSRKLPVGPNLSTYGIVICTLLSSQEDSAGGGEGNRVNKEGQEDKSDKAVGDKEISEPTIHQQITQYLNEMDNNECIPERIWREQGPGVCRRIRAALLKPSSSCMLPSQHRREQHLRHLDEVMHRHGIVMDTPQQEPRLASF